MSSNKSFTFVQKYNVLKGCMEWNPAIEDYDYRQEIARSAYADMLHDFDRNALYNKAIEKSVRKLLRDVNDDRAIRVLDIGTGTGLLSMMAARAFGEQHRNRVKITAYECFEPMADCAVKVIAKNGYNDVIEVIKKRSNEDDVTLPMDERADLLVTEVFDTELIGEGALGTFRFALENQLKPNALVVPSKARIWIQLITSEWLSEGNQFVPVKVNNGLNIIPPKSALNCVGSNHIHDLQINQLKLNSDFRIVSVPKIAFEFDFRDINTLPLNDQKELTFQIIDEVRDEKIMIAMWWDLDMDWEGEHVLSCAPYWANSLKSSLLPWRDHWIQAIYYLPENLPKFNLKRGNKITLNCFHEEYNLWFDITPNSQFHRCNCDLHSNIIRSRLRILNDSKRQNLFHKVISEIKPKNVLFLGDASLVPIMIAKAVKEVSNVYCVTDNNKHNEKFYEEFSQENRVKKLSVISSINDLGEVILDAIVAEPFYNNIIFPWDCLRFWYTLTLIPSNLLGKNVKILPHRAVVKAIPVEFDHLWKIRAKVKKAEGFDLTDFDNLVLEAISDSDPSIESQPLWEYPGRALRSEPFIVFDWKLNKFDFANQENESLFKFSVDKNLLKNKVNTVSLAFWIDYYLSDEDFLTTGIIDSTKLGEYIEWDKNWKQGVSFLFAIRQQQKEKDSLEFEIKVKYDYNNGEMGLELM
ncbi:hypothetical protein B4U79_11921 [Dinothrombium tinctorium]|uniref:Protein arginine N-methyltransferase n=1 Tax=Dinothrombium tinctorium TaxID=1965070 RepID=A0A443QNW2_9ACAR|nr:hypothetical protein B4U79_14955 [Dinothrombium tinctorium]RWS04728.1 hypothetical protein B4U79_11921 [Dinothrombium tinctorium]